MMAADEGGNALVTVAGTSPNGRTWVFSDIHLGAWGGRHDRDGVDGLCGVCVSTANTPCEILELEYPLRIERYGFVQDACGPGRYRGGLGLVRDYRVLEDRTMIQVRSDRVQTLPYGLLGGKPGTPGRNIVNPGPNQFEPPSKFMLWLDAGDLYRCQLAGAGGWGDPLERDPVAVQRDVRDEKISIDFAAREHGVVIDPGTLLVDEAATVELRSRLRAARPPEPRPGG
jgi:N-methylhydantoinase B